MRFRFEYVLLILLILFGIFFRFYELEQGHVSGDESIYLVGAVKYHAKTKVYDPVRWNYEHPPIAKYLMGLPVLFLGQDFPKIASLGVNLYVGIYSVYNEIQSTYVYLRMMSAIFGVLLLLVVFLIAKRAYGFKTALWSTALVSLSFDFITFSRLGYLDIYMLFLYSLAILLLILFMDYFEKNRKLSYIFLILSGASFILTLGTKAFYGITLPIILLAAFWFRTRDSKHLLYYFALLLLCFGIFSLVIFPYTISSLSTEHFRDIAIAFSFNLPTLIFLIFTRNSYLFLIGVIVVLFSLGRKFIKYEQEKFSENEMQILEYMKSEKRKRDVLDRFRISSSELDNLVSRTDFEKFQKDNAWYYAVKSFKPKKPVFGAQFPKIDFNVSPNIFIIYFWFLLFFVLFSILAPARASRYITLIFIPFSIIVGKEVANYSSNKLFFALLALAAIITIGQLFLIHPYYDDFANFNQESKLLNRKTESAVINNSLEFLERKGNPTLISNELNLLLFYPGEKYAFPMQMDDKNCNSEFVGEMRQKDPTIIFSYREDLIKYYCQSFLDEIEFQEDLTPPDKSPILKVYKFK